MNPSRVLASFFALWAAVIFSAVTGAQEPQTVWSGVYTEEQARRGAVLFDQECAQCHGSSGSGGGMAGALMGAGFSANYDGQTVGALFDRNRKTMPPGKEGEIGAGEMAAITAFMLQFNGFPAGQTELPSQSMALMSITYVAQKPSGGGSEEASRPPGTHQDDTVGTEWIRRLERPDRIAGLRIEEVIARLNLKAGDVIADIGAGTGAFTIPFAKAVAPSGRAIAVDIWPELLDYIKEKGMREKVTTLETLLAERDDPSLPQGQVDIAFFHDVFHNVNDRQAYLSRLASSLKPGGRIAIIEQEFDDPIAKKWDKPEDRITPEQVRGWMAAAGFALQAEHDIFQGAKNPKGTGMPERWFVVYGRR